MINDNALVFAILVLALVGMGVAWVDAWRHEPDEEYEWDEGDGDGEE